MNPKTKQLVLIVGAVVLAAVVIYLLIPSGPEEDATTDTAETQTGSTYTPFTPGTTVNAMTVNEHQQPDTNLLIATVSLTQPGFVVIAETLKVGDELQPGQMLAVSRLLPAGTTRNVSINIRTSPGGKYFAALRHDSGDKIYNPTKDPVVNNANLTPIMTLVTADAPIY